jgi:hypothetical protein
LLKEKEYGAEEEIEKKTGSERAGKERKWIKCDRKREPIFVLSLLSSFSFIFFFLSLYPTLGMSVKVFH